MRKSAVVIPALALIAGICGFLIRRVEINTAFEADTGFAVRGAPVTLALIAVSGAVIALAVLAGILASVRMKAENDYTRAFAPGSFLYLAVSSILGIAWLGADVLYFFSVYGQGGTIGLAGSPIISILDIIFIFLAAVSALSVIFLARGAHKGRGGSDLLIFSVIPSVFFCFWLIILYKNNASNPVILSFAYQCLAIAAATLSFYFSAGFVYKKAATGKTLFSFLVTIFFCAVSIADNIGLPLKIMFGLMVLYAFMNAIVFLRNLKSKNEE